MFQIKSIVYTDSPHFRKLLSGENPKQGSPLSIPSAETQNWKLVAGLSWHLKLRTELISGPYRIPRTQLRWTRRRTTPLDQPDGRLIFFLNFARIFIDAED